MKKKRRGNYHKKTYSLSLKVRNYQNVHNWIKRIRGRATFCKVNPKHISKYYQWANISGKYKYELSDWIPTCPACNGSVAVKIKKVRKKYKQRTKSKDYSNKFPLQFYFSQAFHALSPGTPLSNFEAKA